MNISSHDEDACRRTSEERRGTRTTLGVFSALGVVRLQKRQIESELKVRQNERVPSRFDTRLWLYGCTDMCNLKPSDLNEELEAPYLN